MRSSPSVRRERRRSWPLLLERLEGRIVPSFDAARAFDVGRSAHSVAVADFNGDSAFDVAVPTLDGVSVLLGTGDGTFGTARNFSAGLPRSVAVGDFNGDGALDLVVASGTVRVLLGNGDGTFQTTHVSYAAGNRPWSVAVADFNDDGWLDAVTANLDSGDVSILLNDGAWAGPGGAPGAGGGRAPSVPDLFLGEELARTAGRAVRQLAALAVLPDTGLRQAAVHAGALVLVERPRTAYWAGSVIDLDWDRYAAPWEYLWELARQGKAGQPLDHTAFPSSTDPGYATKQKCRLVNQPGFPPDLADRIQPAGRYSQQLQLPAAQIRLFEVVCSETVRERRA